MSTETPAPIPVTVLTGYLGAGKTTLLNRILSENHGRRYAVIVNEFGSIGVDGDLVVNVEEDVFQLNNGCLCCSMRGDLIRVIEGLMRRRNAFDAIIVETTGLADPAPIAQTFFADDDIRQKTKLDAIVTVVDVHHILQEIERAPEAQVQLAYADVVVLNKIDLVTEEDLSSLEARIRYMNATATIRRAERCRVSLDDLLDRGAFDLDRILDFEPEFLQGELQSRHGDGVKSFSLLAEEPLDPQKFLPWVEQTAQVFGTDMLRMKGIISFENDDDRFVVQAVHMLLEGGHQRQWRPGEQRFSRLVFIGRDLPQDTIRNGFMNCQVERVPASMDA